jgi:hypothetical protein
LKKEAYREQDFDYLKRRKIFAMWRKTIYNVKIKVAYENR